MRDKLDRRETDRSLKKAEDVHIAFFRKVGSNERMLGRDGLSGGVCFA